MSELFSDDLDLRQHMIELIQKIKRELGMLQVGSLSELQILLKVDSVEVVLKVLRYMEEYHQVYTLYTDTGVFLIANAPPDSTETSLPSEQC